MLSYETVKVVVRIRSSLQLEKQMNSPSIVQGNPDLSQVSIPNSKLTAEKTFTFDRVFLPDSQQSELYNSSVSHIVESVLCGYNGTVLAYGGAGSGKSFTMFGDSGIIHGAFSQIFDRVEGAPSTTKFLIRCSLLEISNNRINDLLSSNNQLKLDNKDSRKMYIKGLTTKSIKTIDDFLGTRDSVKLQKENSHLILSIHFESQDESSYIKTGKLTLVDLGAQDSSLESLNNLVFSSTENTEKCSELKLVKLLQESFGGNSRTLVIGALSPSLSHHEDSLKTLHFLAKAQLIQNKPTVQESPHSLLRNYIGELLKPRTFPSAAHSLSDETNPSALYSRKLSRSRNVSRSRKTIAGHETTDQNLQESLSLIEDQIIFGKYSLSPAISSRTQAILQESNDAALFTETAYSSSQEELQGLRALVELLRVKYSNSLTEIKSLEQGHQDEKQELLCNVKSKDLEIDLLTTLVEHFIEPSELSRIKAKAEFDPVSHSWKFSIPTQQKDIVLPKLPKHYLQKEQKQKKLRGKNYEI